MIFAEERVQLLPQQLLVDKREQKQTQEHEGRTQVKYQDVHLRVALLVNFDRKVENRGLAQRRQQISQHHVRGFYENIYLFRLRIQALSQQLQERVSGIVELADDELKVR